MESTGYIVNVRVDIRHNDSSLIDQLTISEDFKIEASSFMEVAKILGQFHDLNQKIGQVADD